MRVLHCIPGIWPGSGGPSRAVIGMCRAVASVDPSVVVDIATTDHGLSNESRRQLEGLLPSTSQLHVFPESRWLDPGGSVPMIRWLGRTVAQYDVLHIHALFGSTSSMCARVAMRAGIPYVVHPLGTLSPYTFANRRRLMKRL